MEPVTQFVLFATAYFYIMFSVGMGLALSWAAWESGGKDPREQNGFAVLLLFFVCVIGWPAIAGVFVAMRLTT